MIFLPCRVESFRSFFEISSSRATNLSPSSSTVFCKIKKYNLDVYQITWFHRFLFNESSNFFNEFFWYVFLGGRTCDCNKKITLILENRIRRFAVSFVYVMSSLKDENYPLCEFSVNFFVIYRISISTNEV